MPLVSPHLLRDPADVRAMIDGQRFFLRAFQTKPLAERVERVAIPDPGGHRATRRCSSIAGAS